METKKDSEEVVTRLNGIIALLMENMVASGLIGIGRAIEILYASGLSSTDIGRILERPPTHISSIISKQKKQKRRSRRV